MRMSKCNLPDKDISGEGAFFVDVGAFPGFSGNFEAKSDRANVFFLGGRTLRVKFKKKTEFSSETFVANYFCFIPSGNFSEINSKNHCMK